MKDTVIAVRGVSKDFVLPHEKVGTLKALFTSWYKSKAKSATTQHALDGISFEVKKGEFFGIVGRNGSGKSTLLKILAEIYQPTNGSIETQGKLVPFIELGVGFNPELTGRENVYLNGAMLGFDQRQIDAMYEDIVAFAELGEFMDQKLKNYSSGMQVRLAFSMATRSEADILLVDEVLAVGDADFQRKCYEHFRKLKRQKKTVVFVSHDMSAVREFCDKAILIENSKLIFSGTSDEVAEKYSRLFLREEAAKEGDESQRWGDGLARITDTNVKVTESQITIRQKIVATEDMESPVIGFRLRNSAGQELVGTNTKLEHVSVGDLKKKETATVEWKFENVFGDGTYLIDPAVVHADGITVSDWWDEAVEFTIKKRQRSPYLVDPKFTVSLSESRSAKAPK